MGGRFSRTSINYKFTPKKKRKEKKKLSEIGENREYKLEMKSYTRLHVSQENGGFDGVPEKMQTLVIGS